MNAEALEGRWSPDILLLDSAESYRLLTLDIAVEAVEAAYAAHASGSGRLFPVALQHLDPPDALFVVKSGIWPERDMTGLKLVNYRSTNEAHGLDNHQAVMLVCDAETGCLRALVDGNAITTQRTAAAGAVGVDRLARPDVETIAVLGSGLQARAQLAAALHARPGLRTVRLWARDREKAARLVDAAGEGRDASVAASAAEAVRGADVVVTCTASREPLFDAADVAPGAHVNAIGSDADDKRELPVELVERVRVVVDDVTQSRMLGETKAPVRLAEPPPTMGDVLLGRAAGRTRADEVTIFDSTGIGLQDLAAAQALYRTAASSGAGRWMPWLTEAVHAA